MAHAMTVSCSMSSSYAVPGGPDVQFIDLGNKVVLDNGIVQVTISKPGGIVTCIQYGGIDNLLEVRNKETNRGYWDLNWSEPDGKDNFDVPSGTEFELIFADGNKVEVSFARPYDPNSHLPMVPLNIDKRSFSEDCILALNLPDYRKKDDVVWKAKGWVEEELENENENINQLFLILACKYNCHENTSRTISYLQTPSRVKARTTTFIKSLSMVRFVLLRGYSGFYSYGIYERPWGWPDFNLNQTRITFKLRKDRFEYMAIADDKQRLMPSPDDRMPNRCQELAYPEAVLLARPRNPSLQGEVDDKYQYSLENRENRVQGWISANPLVGFWIITPSDEFRNGGPTKQNLTSHVGPTCLAMFHSAHYAGLELCPRFRDHEPWEKVFGPVFIYLNSGALGMDVRSLWNDAKQQMHAEVRAWPYSWPSSPDFAKAEDRGQIAGRLLVQDRFARPEMCSGTFSFLGLAAPGEKGSWQTESKGYQFWAQADVNGYFAIKNVRAGTYDLYGWVPGVVGDYKKEGEPLSLGPGDIIQLGDLVYEPPRHGPTLWEIGVPDRTAAKFFIPDPNPKYINRLFLNHPERYRQYGLWSRYSDFYPTEDVIYTVGRSDWRRDWFFAHICRMEADGSCQPSVWQIKFQISKGNGNGGAFKFRMAIASSNNAAIQVRVNDLSAKRPLFDTMQLGKDNAIARHGIHGLYWLFSVDIPATSLREGENIIFLTQRKPTGPFTGVMYDYLRLEAPPSSPDTRSLSA